MRKLAFFLFFIMLFSHQVLALGYKNVQVKWDGNYLVFYYDLTGNPNEEAVVGVEVRINGRVYVTRQLHLRGDIGLVSVGNNKRIYWNVFKDFPKGIPKNSSWSLLVRPQQYTNDLGMQFVYIPGGCFYMGASPNDKYAQKDEKPRHKV